MNPSIPAIVKAISDVNNRYRDPAVKVINKLEALWEIGDCLIKLKVNKPHATGWAVQKETKGLIKRPTIFRSFKIRQIWATKEDMFRDIGGIKKLSFFTDMLPLIDPQQEVRQKLEKMEWNEIYKRACSDTSGQFKNYILELKSKYCHGRLGKPLDKSKHLVEIGFVSDNFGALQRYLLGLIKQKESIKRDKFRNEIAAEELRVFSNMCISLTTKDNFRLYRKSGQTISNGKNENFKMLYDYFWVILNKSDDTERARVRRLISPEAFAQMSDMISSIQNENSLDDFRSRQQLSIGL